MVKMGSSNGIGKNRCDMNSKCCCPISNKHCKALSSSKFGQSVDCLSRDYVMTDHHIEPTSRGGNNSKENKCNVIKRLHRKYHHLFGNKLPSEILYFLENTFWDGQRFWIDGYLRILPSYNFDRNELLNQIKLTISTTKVKCSCPISNSSCRVLWKYRHRKGVIEVDRQREAYNELFGDMNPTEILAFIEKTFWNRQKWRIQKYALTHSIEFSEKKVG
ncbi:MAG: hypothetical protein WCK37_00770 [Candidatus Falkowbacteria bacterium]